MHSTPTASSPQPASPDASSAPLRPREHGAYAMLTFPVVSGLVLGGLSVAGVSFALLAVAGFLAHESAVVVLGQRGERVRSAAASAAWRRLGRLAVVAGLVGALFAVTAPGAAWSWAVPAAALGTAVAGLLLLGGTKTLPGELLVATAFASLHGVVAASGGAGGGAAGAGVAVWAGSFALATLSVHALKVRFRTKGSGAGSGKGARKGRSPGRWLVVASPAAAGGALLLPAAAVLAGWSPYGIPLGLLALALVPKAALVLAVTVLDVHPRHLKRVGWSMVAADVVTLVVLVLVTATF